MKAPDEKVLKQAYKLLVEDGKKMSEVRDITELNYSQIWLYVTDHDMKPADRIKAADRTPATVRRLRDVENNSWGLIQVRFGYLEFSEGKIRKMYEESSGDKSIGLRIGRGGRFLNNDGRLYAGDRRQPGIRIPVAMKRSEVSEIAVNLEGGPRRVTGAVKKAAKKAPVSKKAVGKKVAKKVAAKAAV